MMLGDTTVRHPLGQGARHVEEPGAIPSIGSLNFDQLMGQKIKGISILVERL